MKPIFGNESTNVESKFSTHFIYSFYVIDIFGHLNYPMHNSFEDLLPRHIDIFMESYKMRQKYYHYLDLYIYRSSIRKH